MYIQSADSKMNCIVSNNVIQVPRLELHGIFTALSLW